MRTRLTRRIMTFQAYRSYHHWQYRDPDHWQYCDSAPAVIIMTALCHQPEVNYVQWLRVAARLIETKATTDNAKNNV